jgi:serine/threonine protein kinase
VFVALLGSGCVGYVLANRGCAFKVMKHDLKGDHKKKAIVEFTNEIQILSHIDHPNIVKMLTYRENPPQICMELLNGKDLSYLISHNFDQIPVANCIKDVLLALNYLKENSIVHRDIYSRNIVSTTDHTSSTVRYKVIDFGKSVTSDEYAYGGPTFSYCAPETMLMQKSAYPMDIWGVGVIFCRLLTKERLVPLQVSAGLDEDNSDETYGKSLAMIEGQLETELSDDLIKKWESTTKTERLAIFSRRMEVLTKYRQVKVASTIQGEGIAFDLLSKLLKINPDERILPENALQHSYFTSVIEESEINDSAS